MSTPPSQTPKGTLPSQQSNTVGANNGVVSDRNNNSTIQEIFDFDRMLQKDDQAKKDFQLMFHSYLKNEGMTSVMRSFESQSRLVCDLDHLLELVQQRYFEKAVAYLRPFVNLKVEQSVAAFETLFLQAIVHYCDNGRSDMAKCLFIEEFYSRERTSLLSSMSMSKYEKILSAPNCREAYRHTEGEAYDPDTFVRTTIRLLQEYLSENVRLSLSTFAHAPVRFSLNDFMSKYRNPSATVGESTQRVERYIKTFHHRPQSEGEDKGMRDVSTSSQTVTTSSSSSSSSKKREREQEQDKEQMTHEVHNILSSKSAAAAPVATSGTAATLPPSKKQKSSEQDKLKHGPAPQAILTKSTVVSTAQGSATGSEIVSAVTQTIDVLGKKLSSPLQLPHPPSLPSPAQVQQQPSPSHPISQLQATPSAVASGSEQRTLKSSEVCLTSGQTKPDKKTLEIIQEALQKVRGRQNLPILSQKQLPGPSIQPQMPAQVATSKSPQEKEQSQLRSPSLTSPQTTKLPTAPPQQPPQHVRTNIHPIIPYKPPSKPTQTTTLILLVNRLMLQDGSVDDARIQLAPFKDGIGRLIHANIVVSSKSVLVTAMNADTAECAGYWYKRGETNVSREVVFEHENGPFQYIRDRVNGIMPSICFNKHGNYAVACAGGTASLLQRAKGPKRKFGQAATRVYGKGCTDMVLNPNDANLIFCAFADGSLTLRSIPRDDGYIVILIQPTQDARINKLACIHSPSEKNFQILVLFEKGDIMMFECISGKYQKTGLPPVGSGSVRDKEATLCADPCASGKFLVVFNGSLYLRDIKSIKAVELVFENLRIVAATFDRSGDLVICSCSDGTIHCLKFHKESMHLEHMFYFKLHSLLKRDSGSNQGDAMVAVASTLAAGEKNNDLIIGTSDGVLLQHDMSRAIELYSKQRQQSQQPGKQ